MIERILELCKILNLQQKDLAKQIGVTPATITDMKKRRCPISERTIISICSRFSVNEDWLRFGTGEIFNQTKKDFQDFMCIYNQLSLPLQVFLKQTAKNLLDLQKDI